MRSLAPLAPSRAVAGLLTAALTVGAAVVGVTVATVAPAAAAGRITVVNDQGTAAADTRYRTTLTVNGSGFQVVEGGFGGVYLMFGWVDDPQGGSWKPSRGGVTGEDYRYIPDAEDASNQGYLKFIAFPGSSTAEEAQAVLAADGSFSLELTVPGPTFQSVDRDGAVQSVDCTKVTCGVITIGAHGVKNPANETFTPVEFTTVYDDAPADQPEQAPEQDGGTADRPADAGADDGAVTTPARLGRPRITTDRSTAQAGHALVFTGGGFQPGEQVVGVLDDGVAAIGPMLAGRSGEVAGVLQLPLDLPAGTHELRLTGAASGAEATERFAVRAAEAADDVTAGAEAAAADDSDAGLPPSQVFLLAAAAALALAVLGLLVRLLLRRRTRTATGGTS